MTKTFRIPTRGERPLVQLLGLDAETFAEMRAAIDAQRPELRADINAKIERALEIIRTFDPLPLLIHIAMKHGVSAPGQEEPPEGPAPTIRIEYALSLALAIADDDARPKPPDARSFEPSTATTSFQRGFLTIIRGVIACEAAERWLARR